MKIWALLTFFSILKRSCVTILVGIIYHLLEIQPHLFYHMLAILFAGGRSLGCPENSGAAGTYYDAVPRILVVSNHNRSTTTDTLLLEFPKQPLWTNVYIENHAKALVPLFWSRVQVIEETSRDPI